jgi:hypothetical protein
VPKKVIAGLSLIDFKVEIQEFFWIGFSAEQILSIIEHRAICWTGTQSVEKQPRKNGPIEGFKSRSSQKVQCDVCRTW